jgi:hypothetical protein
MALSSQSFCFVRGAYVMPRRSGKTSALREAEIP